MVTAAAATPLAPLTTPVVAAGAIVLPLEIVLANVHPLASAGVGLIRAPLESWICLVIVSWLLQAPVASRREDVAEVRGRTEEVVLILCRSGDGPQVVRRRR